MERWMRLCLRLVFWLLLLLPLPLLLTVTFFVVFGLMVDSHYGQIRPRATRAQIAMLDMAVEAFRLDCGRLPGSLDELLGVFREPDCVKSTHRLSSLIDPYGEPFVYWRAADASRFEIRSLGRDRVYGSADDVSSNDWSWPWPRPWYERVDGWRRVSALLPLLLAGAIVYRVVAAFAGAFRIAWRRWHRPPQQRGNS